MDKLFRMVSLIDNGKFLSKSEFESAVKSQMTYLKKIKPSSVVLCGDDSFVFLVNFYSCVYLNIEVILVTDLSRLKNIENSLFINKLFLNETLSEIPSNINVSNYVVKFLTSGSTGTPKFVKKTLRNLISEAEIIKDEFDFISIKNFATTSTLAHLFGFTFCFMLPMVLEKSINTKRVLYPEEDLMEDSVFVSTPSFLSKMVKYSVYPNSKPKIIIAGGAKLEDSDFEVLEKMSKIIAIYGSTETGVIGYREKSYSFYNLFSDVKISNEMVFSPFIYEGEYSLGDNIEILESGGIKVLSRKDRILKIQEQRISACEIENIIKKNEYINQVYCFKYSEKLACIVVLNDIGINYFLKIGMLKFIKELKSDLKEQTNIVPQKWKFLDEIPQNKCGKIDIEEINNLFGTKITQPLILNKKLNEKEVEIELVFHKDSNFFKGHFENYPIVPGVVQLFFVSYYLKQFWGLKLDLGQLKKIKFSSIIIPDKKINLLFINKEKSISYKYSDDKNVYSSGEFPKNNILENVLEI